MPIDSLRGHPTRVSLFNVQKIGAWLTRPKPSKHGGIAILALALCSVTWLSGCGAGAGNESPPQFVNLGAGSAPVAVGTQTCIQCHFAYPSNYFTNGDAFDADRVGGWDSPAGSR